MYLWKCPLSSILSWNYTKGIVGKDHEESWKTSRRSRSIKTSSKDLKPFYSFPRVRRYVIVKFTEPTFRWYAYSLKQAVFSLTVMFHLGNWLMFQCEIHDNGHSHEQRPTLRESCSVHNGHSVLSAWRWPRYLIIFMVLKNKWNKLTIYLFFVAN